MGGTPRFFTNTGESKSRRDKKRVTTPRFYSPPPLPGEGEEIAKESHGLPAVFAPIRDVVGGILDVTGAGAGAIAGAAAAAFGSDAYGDVLQRKYDEEQAVRAASGDVPGVFRDAISNLTLAPKVGEVLTEGWEPDSTAGKVGKETASLLATIATDPASFTPKGVASIAAAAKRAKAAEIAKGFVGPAQRLSIPGAAMEATEGFLGSVVPASIYAPDILETTYEGAKGAVSSAQEGDYGGAAAQGAQSMLMAGLAALMGKGLLNEREAWKVMQTDATGKVPVDPKLEPEVSMPTSTPETDAAMNADIPVKRTRTSPVEPGRVFYGRPDGSVVPGVAGNVPRTFYGGPTGQVRAGEVDVVPSATAGELAEEMPPVGIYDGLPESLRVPVLDFGERPAEEYVPSLPAGLQPPPEAPPAAAVRPRKPKPQPPAPAAAAKVPDVPEPSVEVKEGDEPLITRDEEGISSLTEKGRDIANRVNLTVAREVGAKLENGKPQWRVDRDPYHAAGNKFTRNFFGALYEGKSVADAIQMAATGVKDYQRFWRVIEKELGLKPSIDRVEPAKPKTADEVLDEEVAKINQMVKDGDLTVDEGGDAIDKAVQRRSKAKAAEDAAAAKKAKEEAAAKPEPEEDLSDIDPTRPEDQAEAKPDEDEEGSDVGLDEDDPMAAIADEINRKSREGYRARELAQEYGVPESEIRRVRTVSNEEIQAGAAKRFANAPKKEKVEKPAPEPVKVATPEEIKTSVEEFLKGKESVTEGELRDLLKSKGLSTIGKKGVEKSPVQKALAQLEALGVFKKAEGKKRIPREDLRKAKGPDDVPPPPTPTSPAPAPRTPAPPAGSSRVSEPAVGKEYTDKTGKRYRVLKLKDEVHSKTGKVVGRDVLAEEIDPNTGAVKIAGREPTKISLDLFNSRMTEAAPVKPPAPSAETLEESLARTTVKPEDEASFAPGPIPEKPDPKYDENKKYFVREDGGAFLPEIDKAVKGTATALVRKLQTDRAELIKWATSGVNDAIAGFDPTKGDAAMHAKKAANRMVFKMYAELKGRGMGSDSTAWRGRAVRSMAAVLEEEMGRKPSGIELRDYIRASSPEMAKITEKTINKFLAGEKVNVDDMEAELASPLQSDALLAEADRQMRIRGLAEKVRFIQQKAIDEVVGKLKPSEQKLIRDWFETTLLRQEDPGVTAADVAKAAGRKSPAGITNLKNKIEELVKKEIDSNKDLRDMWRAVKQTVDDLPEDTGTFPAAMAMASNWTAPLKSSPGLHVLQSSDIADEFSAKLADSAELGRVGRILQSMSEKIAKKFGSDSKFMGFGFSPGWAGLHSSLGDGTDPRIYINPLAHARNAVREAKLNLPVDGRPGDLANRLVANMMHEHVHNKIHEGGKPVHGPEFWAAHKKLYDQMVEDGSYSAMRNDIYQALQANDFHLYKWLAANGEEVPKHVTAEPRKVAPIRDTGEAGSAAGTRGQGDATREAVAGQRSGAGSEEAVRADEGRSPEDVATSANVRGSEAAGGRLSPADRKRYTRAIDLQMSKDPEIRKVLNAFADSALKDMSPEELLKMAPKISPRLTADILKQAADAVADPDAYLKAHPEAREGYKSTKKELRGEENVEPGRAKPGGDPDLALNLLRLDINPELKKQMQVLYHVLEPLQLRAETQHWASEEVLLSRLGKFKGNKDLVNHVKRYGITEEDLTLMRMMDVFNNAELMNTRGQLLQLQSLIDENKASDTQIALHQSLTKELGIRATMSAQMALDLSGEKTKIGRLLASLRRPVGEWDPHMLNASQMGRFLYALEKQGVDRPTRELLWKMLQSKEENAMNEFQAALQKALQYNRWQQFAEYYTAGLVSGLPTKLANFSSNAAFRVLRDIENTFAVGVDATRSKLTGAKRTRFLGETQAWMYGYQSQWSQAWKNWAQSHQEIITAKALSQKPGLSFIGGSVLDVAKSTGSIPGVTGEIIRSGYKSMEADDNLFKHLGGGAELFKQLYRMGRKNNLTHEQALKAMHSQVEAIMKADAEGALELLLKDKPELKDILIAVDKQARADTYQGDLHGTVMKEIAHKIQLLSNVHPMLKLIVPFVRTPANILSETIKRTPIGLINVMRKSGSMEGGEFAEELSKSLLGTMGAMNLAFVAYAASGDEDSNFKITGQGPLEPRLQAQKKATGWQPYSFKVGARYIPYQRYEPFSSILGMAADMAEAVRQGDTQTAEKFGKRLAASVAKNLTNKTFLAGISNLVEAWHEPERNLEFFISQLEQSMVPMSGLTRSVARAVDPTFRETTLVNAPLSAIPFASETLPPQYAPTGEERQRPGGSFLERAIAPGATTVEVPSKKTNLLNVMTEIGYAPRIDDHIRNKKFGRVDLEPAQVAVLARARALANNKLEGIIDSPEFQALPDNDEDPRAFGGRKTKRDFLERVHRKYYQAALKKLLPEIGRKAIEGRLELGQ